ncbi:MAG: EF-hand domain-containing protein [Deltaproteobacteria bacterium]|nr:EF-hand domain-containing protein [Deltaproteobacteria bacterium]
MFNKMDQNSDGAIDKTEMQTVMDEIAEQSGQTVNVDDLFSQYDSDGDGQFSQDETDTAMESLRKEASQYGGMQAGMAAGSMPPPPPDFGQMFDDTDADADGSIDQSEMQTLADKIAENSGQTIDVEDLFSQYDSDSDGKLSEDEAKAAMESLGGPPRQAGGMQGAMGPGSMPPPPPDFAQILKDADTDSDGSIAKTEMQTVADKITGQSGQTISVEDLFSQYDSDSDGKLSETEATDALASLFESLQPDSATMKKLFYESSSYKPVDVTA